jgi:hypothetical protein
MYVLEHVWQTMYIQVLCFQEMIIHICFYVYKQIYVGQGFTIQQ